MVMAVVVYVVEVEVSGGRDSVVVEVKIQMVVRRLLKPTLKFL